MEKMFQYDNPVWNILGKIADMVFISLLWIFCSLPVITLGAATTAAYSSARILLEDEGELAKTFMTSFRINFRKSTVLWLMVLTSGIVFSADLYFFTQIGADWAKVMVIVTLIFSFILLVMAIYMFSMISKFEGNLKQLAGMAFVLSIRALPSTILMVLLFLAVVSVVLLKYWFVGLIAAGLIAFIHTWILEDVYRKHGLVEKETARV